MKNILTLNVEGVTTRDCLVSIDDGSNSIELQFVRIRDWDNPTIHISLVDESNVDSTDYVIDSDSPKSLTYVIPQQYWNVNGSISLYITDTSFVSSRFEFACVSQGYGNTVLKAAGTSVFTYNISSRPTVDLSLINMIYPIGSVIENASSEFDPNVMYYGTTWERIKGKVLVGVDESDTTFASAGLTGGSKTNTHEHYQTVSNDGSRFYATSTTGSGTRSRVVSKARGVADFASKGTGTTREDSTYQETINILQPYETVYIWKRTA